MKRKSLFLSAALLLLVFSLAGCNKKTTDSKSDESNVQGRVESIDGNKVTLSVMGNRQPGETPEKGTDGEPPEMPENGTDGERPEMPENAPDGESAEKPDAPANEDGKEPSQRPQGESKTYTFSDELLADIAEGDFIKIELDGDTVVSAEKMTMNRPDSANSENNNDKSTPSPETETPTEDL